MQFTQVETKTRKTSSIGQESRMNVQKAKRSILKQLKSLGPISAAAEDFYNLKFSGNTIAIDTKGTSISGGIGKSNRSGGILYDTSIGIDDAKKILKIAVKQIARGASEAGFDARLRWGQNYFVIDFRS